MSNYIPVPVEAAKDIAERFQKSIVIIFAHDPVHGQIHTTTFGVSAQEKLWAAQGGEIATKALGGVTELSVEFQDYRLEQARKLANVLKEALAEAPGWREAVVELEDHCSEPVRLKNMLAAADQIDRFKAAARAALKEAEAFL